MNSGYYSALFMVGVMTLWGLLQFLTVSDMAGRITSLIVLIFGTLFLIGLYFDGKGE